MLQVLSVAEKLTDAQLEAMGAEQGERPVSGTALKSAAEVYRNSAEVKSWYAAMQLRTQELVVSRCGQSRATRAPWNGTSAAIQGAALAAVMYPAGVIDVDQYIEMCRPWHQAWTSEGRYEKKEQSA